MKKIFILSFLFMIINSCYAQEVEYPKPIGYVNDFANVLPDNDEASLSQLIQELKQKTGAEVALVTIPSIAPLEIEDYAVRLFEKWGIGKKGTDNGVLILIAVNERKMRIEVGYGLEGALPDGKCGEIRDKFMIPYFKQGDLGKGIMAGTAAIVQIVANEYSVQLEGSPHSEQKRHTASPLQLLLFLFLLPFIIIARLFSPFSLLSGGYGYRGGSFGMGGFGGGFGGFGGGLSGGGGASGRW